MVGRLAHALLGLTLGIVSVEGNALAQGADGDPLLRLQFAPGASRLQPGAAGPEGLGRVRAFLASHPDVTKLRIEAHANNVGTPQSAQGLTVERALGVKNALIALGTDGGRLLAVAFGQNRPIADNATAAGRGLNERVEFRIAERDGLPLGDVTGGGMLVRDAAFAGGGAAPPSSAQATRAAEATSAVSAAPNGCPSPDYPIALSQVRGVILDPSSDGPAATEGGVTKDAIRQRAARVLEPAGIKIFRTNAESREAKVYAPWFTLDVYSLAGTTAGPPYCFEVGARMVDTTTLTDGSRSNVIVWSKAEFGSGDGPRVVPRVNELIDKIVAEFLTAVRASRAKK